MKKIILIRHGETTGDLEDRYGGVYDDHLTERGEQQLQNTANEIKNKNIEIIFHSPLIRARESAAIINQVIEVPMKEMAGLKERHYGILTGLVRAEALEKFPEAVEAHKDPMNTDPEGESFADFNERVIADFQQILNAPQETIAVVAHGGSLKRILAFLQQPATDSIADGGVIETEL